MPATREYQFITGPETSTLPTAGTPSNDADTITKGYADDKYVQGGDPVADVTALKAIAAADRTDNDVLFVDSLNTLFYFDSGSSATGDDLTVIAPDAGTGRWLRVNQQPYITTAAHFRNQAEARFYEQSGNGTNYTAITGPDDANNSNVTFKLPNADGTSGQALLTNGSAVLSWGNASVGNQAVSAKSADYTVLDADDIGTIVMTTSTTDRTVTLPTAADNSGRTLTLIKADSAVGKLQADGEGSETINGATGAVVVGTNQYDYAILRCDGTGWFIVDMGGSVMSEYWIHTGNGDGSTYSAIKRFSTAARNVGNDITYADSSTDGSSFTINRRGVYHIVYSDEGSGAQTIGITKNEVLATDGTTAIKSVGYAADNKAIQIAGSSDIINCVVTTELAAGDVIRPHHNNAINGAGNACFRITQVRKL